MILVKIEESKDVAIFDSVISKGLGPRVGRETT